MYFQTRFKLLFDNMIVQLICSPIDRLVLVYQPGYRLRNHRLDWRYLQQTFSYSSRSPVSHLNFRKKLILMVRLQTNIKRYWGDFSYQ